MDTLLSNEINNSLNTAQRDFYFKATHRQIRQKRKVIWISSISIILILLIIVAYILYLNKTRRNKEKENYNNLKALNDVLNEKESKKIYLQQSIDNQSKVIKELEELLKNSNNEYRPVQSDNEELKRAFQEKWKLFSKIYDSFFRLHDTNLPASSMHQAYINSIATIKTQEFLTDIQNSVNLYMDNIIARLIEQCPWIKSDEITILTLSYAGISPRGIAYIIGIKLKSMYNKRNKILKRIEKENPEDLEEFLRIDNEF